MKLFGDRKHLFLMFFMMIGISLCLGRAVNAETAPQPVSTVAQVQTAVAQVVWVKGVVKAVSPTKETRVLQRRGVIYEKDTILTDKDSTGQVVFSDNTILALRENTEVHVDKYKFSNGKEPSEDEYLVSIAKGGFRTITGAIAKSNPSNYQVNTPVATIGVRGTQWSIYMDEDRKIYLKIENGSIRVQTPGGEAVLTQGSQNLYAVIRSGQAPEVSAKTPAGASFASDPPLTPAQSTLPNSSSSSTGTPPPTTGTGTPPSTGSGTTSTTTTTTATEATTTTTTTAPKSSGSGGSGTSRTVTGFCIGG
jgi:hypothetical protein